MKYYKSSSEYDQSDKYYVHRTPANFHCTDDPFNIYEVEAENVEEGLDEICSAKRIVMGKPIPLRDIGKISANALIKSGQSNIKNTRKIICEGDALLPDDKDRMGLEDTAISLRWGNAVTTREHSSAIALDSHTAAVAAAKFACAIALGHGGTAAASGPLSHAVACQGGWAISGNGHAVTLNSGSAAVTCGSHGMAVACSHAGKAYAFGEQGRAVACDDSGKSTASGRLGEAVALGEDGKADCNGSYGLAIATGRYGKAKGALGCWLVLAERDRWEKPKKVMAIMVDGENIKADTWYTIKKGKIVEAVTESVKKEVNL